MIISEGAGRTKMRASEFRFKVVKTWLGNESTERIEGWKTRIFEAAGKMAAVTVNKARPHHVSALHYVTLLITHESLGVAAKCAMQSYQHK